MSLGCRDFRSIKSFINQVSLGDNRGCGVQVLSDGKQHARAYLHQYRVHLLIDGFGNGPSEGFMSHHFGKASARTLAYGDSFSDAVRFRLISDGTENSKEQEP